ncbi:hypothetical protein ES705_24077 [subsurface metagenome]
MKIREMLFWHDYKYADRKGEEPICVCKPYWLRLMVEKLEREGHDSL